MGQSLSPGYDLIITNGDAAGELLRKAISNTEVMPWRDVLHDGPVPVTEDHEELSELRADYLADKGWGDHDTLREGFRARDRGLATNEIFERVILWFEHDLYDQLQLIQILDWFTEHERDADTLRLVQSDDFLGTQGPEALVELQQLEAPVRAEQLALARLAWQAFRQSTPQAWAALLDMDISALPHLRGAVKRMLEELPTQRRVCPGRSRKSSNRSIQAYSSRASCSAPCKAMKKRPLWATGASGTASMHWPIRNRLWSTGSTRGHFSPAWRKKISQPIWGAKLN